jgi:putative ABC transport system permease protein
LSALSGHPAMGFVFRVKKGKAALRLQVWMMVLAISQNRFRLFLSQLTIAIAIGSLMVMLALSRGVDAELSATMERFGKNLVVVRTGQLLAPARRGGNWYFSTRLRPDDARRIRTEVPGIIAAEPVVESAMQVEYGGAGVTASVRGTTPQLLKIRNFTIEQGRSINGNDDAARSRVAVLGSFVAERLFEGRNPVSRTVKIAGVPFEVIGQLAPRGVRDGVNEDNVVVVPVSTAMRRLLNVDYLSQIVVQVDDPAKVDAIHAPIARLLREQHKLGAGTQDDFEIQNDAHIEASRRLRNAFAQSLTLTLSALALAISGIGVSSVAFLNVADRKSEIALRMALGARRRDIASLFIAENLLMGIVGAVVGIILGIVSIAFFDVVTGWPLAIDASVIVLPLVASMALSFLFSVLPALKASRLQPSEALKAA